MHNSQSRPRWMVRPRSREPRKLSEPRQGEELALTQPRVNYTGTRRRGQGVAPGSGGSKRHDKASRTVQAVKRATEESRKQQKA